MITIKELATVRKILKISDIDIADEMSTTVDTVNIIEREESNIPMEARFYRLTVLKFIKQIDFDNMIEKI